MRTIATVLLVLALHGLTSAARPGDLDSSFGGTGTVSVPVASGDTNDVLVFPDGSIVVGGRGDVDGDGHAELLLARIDATGGLVPDFGTGGITTTRIAFADQSTIRRLAIDLDGRIVAAAVSSRVQSNGVVASFLHLVRYFPNGEIDREFGLTGDGTMGIGAGSNVAGMVVLENRQIALVGRNDNMIELLVAPPNGFSSNELDESSDGQAVVRTGDGLLLAGTVGGEFFLQRMQNDFNLDLAFGDAGTVRTPVGAGAARLRSVVVLPDGKILAVGAADATPADTDIALVRYTADGLLDETFGDGGIVVAPLGDRRDDAVDAVLAPDGTLLVAGRSCSPVPCHGFLARFLPEGGFDPSFGEGGVVTTEDVIARIVMPDDGHVVALEQKAGDVLAVDRFLVAGCGNGRLEAGEACDDGNNADGDCCSASCTLEPDDSSCADDGSACTADVCRAGACAHVVPTDAGCFAATSSSLARPVGGDRLRWTWQSATTVDRASFGDPTDATNLTLCFIDTADASAAPLLELAVPAAGVCNGAPCWKKTVPGFRYKDASAASDGVTVLRLASARNGSRVVVKAKNVAGIADLPVPVRVRLVRQDAAACFETDLAPARGATLTSR